jgi:hypothetical protein
MRTLLTAFIALVAVGLCATTAFLALLATGVDKEVAKVLATVTMGAYPAFYSSIKDGQLRFEFSLSQKGIVEFAGFLYPPYLLVIAAALVLFASTQIHGVVVWYLSVISGNPAALTSVAITGVLVRLVVGYFLGHWIGVRASNAGVAVTLASAFLGAALVVGLDFIAASEEEWIAVYRNSKSIGLAGLAIGASALLISGPAMLVGYWFGRRAQYASYIQHLLQVLPTPARTTIVELAYEEASRSAPGELPRRT